MFIYVLISLLMLATLAVLTTGVVLMGIGGKVNARWSNRLMIARVTLQTLVVALIGISIITG